MNLSSTHTARWKRVHVADVCETVSVGIVIQPSQYYVEADLGVRAFRSANVGENRVIDRDWVYLSPEGHKKNAKSALQAGDVLVVRSGALAGTACVVSEAYAGTNCIDIVFARPKRDLLVPEYLAEVTNSPVGCRHVADTKGGLAIGHFNVSAFKKLPLFLPSVDEQRHIVTAISFWDTAIQKTEQLIAAKERYYGHELSRLIGRSQHTHAPIGIFAEEASARNRGGKSALLGDLLTESREPDIDHDPAERLTVRLHLQGVEARPVRGTKSDGATAYFRRRAGQLIYGKQNIFRGAIGIIPCELDGYASTQDLPAFDIAGGIDPQWLYSWLSRKDFYASLEALSAGSGSKRLHPEEFFKVRIFVPDLTTQTAIARYLNALREEIDLLGQSLAALKTQKRGLMQKLLTGQWRLPVVAAPSPPTPLPHAGEGSNKGGPRGSSPLSHAGEGSNKGGPRGSSPRARAGEGSEGDVSAGRLPLPPEGSKESGAREGNESDGGAAACPLPRAGEGGRRPGEGQHD